MLLLLCIAAASFHCPFGCWFGCRACRCACLGAIDVDVRSVQLRSGPRLVGPKSLFDSQCCCCSCSQQTSSLCELRCSSAEQRVGRCCVRDSGCCCGAVSVLCRWACPACCWLGCWAGCGRGGTGP